MTELPHYWSEDDAMSVPVLIPLCHDGEDY